MFTYSTILRLLHSQQYTLLKKTMDPQSTETGEIPPPYSSSETTTPPPYFKTLHILPPYPLATTFSPILASVEAESRWACRSSRDIAPAQGSTLQTSDPPNNTTDELEHDNRKRNKRKLIVFIVINLILMGVVLAIVGVFAYFTLKKSRCANTVGVHDCS